MQLTKDLFIHVKQKIKQIKFYLFDTKKQQLNINDFIIFSLIDNPEKNLTVEIIELYRSQSFLELFNILNKITLGWDSETEINNKLRSIQKYYSKENKKKYGVL